MRIIYFLHILLSAIGIYAIYYNTNSFLPSTFHEWIFWITFIGFILFNIHLRLIFCVIIFLVAGFFLKESDYGFLHGGVLVVFISNILYNSFLFIVSFFYTKNIDPITSITYKGCMGINIGDEWNFVLSRMVHLNLITRKESKEYTREYREHKDFSKHFSIPVPFCFTTTTKFNNIDFVEFMITEGKLFQIKIKLVAEQTNMKYLLEECELILKTRLNKEPYFTGKELWWKGKKNSVRINIKEEYIIIYKSSTLSDIFS